MCHKIENRGQLVTTILFLKFLRLSSETQGNIFLFSGISNPLVDGDDSSRLQEEIGHGLRVRFDKREVAHENRGGPGTGGLNI